MITKLVGRLQHFKAWRNVYYFSKDDDDYPRGKSFFGRKPSKDETIIKENPFKRKKDNQNKPFSRQAFNRKEQQKQQKQRVPKEEQQQAEPFAFLSTEAAEERSYSIFHEQPETPVIKKKPAEKAKRQVKQPTYSKQSEQFVSTMGDKPLRLHEKVAEESEKLLSLFDEQNWRDLSNLVGSFEDISSQKDVIKQVHPLLANRDPIKYLAWLKNTRVQISDLPDRALKNLVSKLIQAKQFKDVSHLCKSVNSKSLNIGLSFLDTFFADFDEKGSIKQLRAEIPDKINAAIALLKTSQVQSTENDPKAGIKAQYALGKWFQKLWYVAKIRKTETAAFVNLFENLVINHGSKVSLYQTHTSGVFLDIIATQYFGTHVSLAKIQQLFEHSFSMSDSLAFLGQFRNEMRHYHIKTGNSPFPNIRDVYSKCQTALENHDQSRALFYFLLCEYGEDTKPFTLFEQNQNLLSQSLNEDRVSNLFNDSLFNLPKEYFVSDPRPEDEENQAKTEKFNNTVKKIVKKVEGVRNRLLREKNMKGKRAKGLIALGLDQELRQTVNLSEITEMSKEDHQLIKSLLANHKAESAVEESAQDVSEAQNEESQATQGESNEVPFKSLEVNKTKVSFEEQLQEIINKFEVETVAELVAFLRAGAQLGIFGQENKFKNQQNQLSADQQSISQILTEMFKKEQNALVQREIQEEQQNENVDKVQEAFAKRLQFSHRRELRRQAQNEGNFYRRQLLNILLSSNDPLQHVKAAIKLDRPELAFTVFKQKIMKTQINERMARDIEYVARAFLREHYKDNKDLNINEIADSINVDRVRWLAYQNGQGQSFLESVYEKLQNFDYLLWTHLPPNDSKHQFWQNALMMQRATELLKLQVSGKLNQMRYEQQYQQRTKREVKQFHKGDLSWRDELIYGLGLSEPEAVPQDQSKNRWFTLNGPTEVYQNIVQPLLAENSILGNKDLSVEPQTKTFNESVSLTKEQVAYLVNPYFSQEEAQALQGQEGEYQEAVEGEQGQEEGVEEVQAQEQETLEAAGEQGVAEAQEEGQIPESVEQTPEQGQVQEGEQLQASQETPVEQEAIQAAQQPIETTEGLPSEDVLNIFRHAEQTNTRGYDFNLFIQQARAKYRPTLQRQYEIEKQFIKHMLALEAIAEEARITDNHYLQKKYNEAQELVRDPITIMKFAQHGLYNFDFVTVSEPEDYIRLSVTFRKNFYEFKKYLGTKHPGAVPDVSKRAVHNFADLVSLREISIQLVQQLLLTRKELFSEAEAVIKMQPRQQVEQIMWWGLFNDEPLAIYMGQKLAMLTNQKISHQLALLAARYLSHRRDVPAERIARCKDALRIVGRINRQHIYELSKDYEHITVRKNLNKYVAKRKEQLDQASLEYLTEVDPIHTAQESKLRVRNSMKRAGLTV